MPSVCGTAAAGRADRPHHRCEGTKRRRALADLPQLTVGRISDADARELLTSAIRGRLDPQVRYRIVVEAQGNPLALLQLPRGRSPAELAGGFWLSDTRPLVSRIEDSFQRDFKSLPRATQRFLITAAADLVGDVPLLWRAAELEGIPADAAGPAEAIGLPQLDAKVRFRHPLARSAVYQAASPRDRRAAHRALGKATDAGIDPDRRAWHRALAASRPDEAVAEELEGCAGRAHARGGVAAAAAFLQRATELTPDAARRGVRSLAAAQAKFGAGNAEAAYKLLAAAEVGPIDDLGRAKLERLRARLVFSVVRGSDAPPPSRPPRGVDVLLDGLATRLAEGYGPGLAPLRRALHTFWRDQGSGVDDVAWRWLWLVCPVTSEPLAVELWDDE